MQRNKRKQKIHGCISALKCTTHDAAYAACTVHKTAIFLNKIWILVRQCSPVYIYLSRSENICMWPMGSLWFFSFYCWLFVNLLSWERDACPRIKQSRLWVSCWLPIDLDGFLIGLQILTELASTDATDYQWDKSMYHHRSDTISLVISANTYCRTIFLWCPYTLSRTSTF
jgi:hypothetical protein